MTKQKRMLVILPSRNRPDKAREAIQHFKATSKQADLILCVDDDDVMLPSYRDVARTTHVKLRVGKRIRMCPTVNAAFEENPDYDYYAFIGDDHRFRTPAWDGWAMFRLDRETWGWGIWYGNDLIQGEKLCTAAVISGKLARELGFIALPGLTHLYMDDFHMTVAGTLALLVYDDDYVIEHMHYTVGKSERDEGYAEVNAQEMYDHDAEVLDRWKKTEMGSTIERIAKKVEAEL